MTAWVLAMPLSWVAACEYRRRTRSQFGTLRFLFWILCWPLVCVWLWAVVVTAAIFGITLAALTDTRTKERDVLKR